MPDGAAPQLTLSSATALTKVASGQWTVGLSPEWWLTSSAFGGYLSATMLRAALATETDRGKIPLSFAVNFLARIAGGEATLLVTAERVGSRVSTYSVRLEQRGVTLVVGLAVLGVTQAGPVRSPAPPVVPDPAQCEPLVVRPEVLAKFPMGRRFDRRRLPVPTESSGKRRNTGGWLRFTEPSPVDAGAALAFLDAWTPAVSTLIDDKISMSTISYFVQFLADFSEPMPGDEFYLALFAGESARGGYAEDDGELWSSSGQLLARSKQLVLVTSR